MLKARGINLAICVFGFFVLCRAATLTGGTASRRLLDNGPIAPVTACVPASLDTGFPFCGNLGQFSNTMCCVGNRDGTGQNGTCHQPSQADFEYGQECLEQQQWYCCSPS